MICLFFCCFCSTAQAQKSFEAWGGKKEEAIKSKRQDSKKKEQTLKEQEDEKLQKAKDAKKFFESWKQQKDEEIKVGESVFSATLIFYKVSRAHNSTQYTGRLLCKLEDQWVG